MPSSSDAIPGSTASQPSPAGSDPGAELEWLSRTERSWVWRQRRSDGHRLIGKQPVGPDALQRVQHERAILRRLAGLPGIVRLAPGPQPEELLWLADDDGMSLSQWLQGQHHMPLAQLLPLAGQLATTLAAVHAQGLVHKDINPSNILLCGPEQVPVLIDFNLASSTAEEQPGFTHPREIAGTLAYMAPEQTGRSGRTLDQRADLYALGATLYQLATGRRPFETEDPLALIHAQLARTPVAPIALVPGLPPLLSQIVMRLLEKDADRRYQSADGLAADLARLAQLLSQSPSHQPVDFPLGERDFPQRLPAPSQLVGRDSEIAALQWALDNALQARGQLLLVSGPPGVGKTALIGELRGMVTARRGWFVSGKTSLYRPDAATGAVVQALRSLGSLLLAEAEDSLQPLRERLLTALGVNAGLVAAALPEFASLLDQAPASPGSDAMRAVQRLRQGLTDLLRVIVSPERPLVLVLEDLQWAAPRTTQFISSVLEDGALPGLLLVGSYREDELGPGHPLHAMLTQWNQLPRPPQQHLSLQNLPPAELSQLLEKMLRLLPAQATLLAQALGERTAGNPYDTVELVNALRRDGVLQPGNSGWHWDAEAVRQHVGHGDVVDLLAQRINSLPPDTATLLKSLACLGSEVPLDLLQAASALAADTLQNSLSPALADGLLVLKRGGPASPAALRFRHDRVHQAANGLFDPGERQALQLVLARHMAPDPAFSAMAAEQYLPVIGLLDDAAEKRRVIELFRGAGSQALMGNHVAAERFLALAIELLEGLDSRSEDDRALSLLLRSQHIGALYALGQHEALDAACAQLARQGHAPHETAAALCLQINSLHDRSRQADALALGLRLLDQLGRSLSADPAAALQDQARRQLEAQWALFYQRAEALDLATDLQRPDIDDPRLLATIEVLDRLQAPAYYLGSGLAAQLLFEGQRIWTEHGPCSRLMHVLGGGVGPLVVVRQDYGIGYRLLRHALAVGEARGWEPETSDTRFYHAMMGMPWFEPLEECGRAGLQAREVLLHWGSGAQAAYSYSGSLIVSLDCAATLESTSVMTDAALALARSSGNSQASALLVSYRQLVNALYGRTASVAELRDGDFDEAAYLAGPAQGMVPATAYHVHAALAAAIDGQAPERLAHHAAQAMALGARSASYRAALAHLLQGLSLAQRMQAAPELRERLLPELDHCHAWLSWRAAEAPVNYSHLAGWLLAERAWALGDLAAADSGFHAVLRQVQSLGRPWHRALLTERMGLFYLAHGPTHLGQHLLAQARQHYADWGASGKVRALQRQHAFLLMVVRPRDAALRSPSQPGATLVSPETLDMVAILRASQALSSETSLARLKSRVAELLGALTGATSVLLVLRGEGKDHGPGWFVSEASDEAAASISVEDAASRGLLPISALRYGLRTRAALVVDDAVLDDRFSRDAYVAARELCALLVLPILSHGEPRAVLMLENRLVRGAFSGERLDAVSLIAGQLAVSLDNAMLYASLERKVARRTADLQELVDGLESFNRSVSHDLRGPLGGIAGLATLANDGLVRNDDTVARRVLPLIARQAEASTRLVATLLALARVGDTRLNCRQLDFQALVHEVLEQLAHAQPGQRLPPVRVQPVPGVYADADLLRPVMVNLLGNAIKFVRGQAEPQIEVGGTAGDREITVSVCDNGVGFDNSAASSLFRPFSRLHGSRFEGHGVGLSIVRRAVERHGGRVWAKSTPNQGACFYFTLPREGEDSGSRDSGPASLLGGPG